MIVNSQEVSLLFNSKKLIMNLRTYDIKIYR